MVMAAALVLSSTVALAVTRQCKTDRDCRGTNERDKLLGTEGSNFMYGGGGNDLISVFDNDDGDFVDCGEDADDNDTVTYDTGDTVTNCETLNPN